VPPGRAAVARGDRHGQARRQDRHHGPRGATARARPRRRRRLDGPRRAARADRARDAADARRPARAVPLRRACGVRLPRDGGARVLTMSDEVAAEARALGADVARFDLRPRPVEPLAGRRTALFTTGPAPFEHLPEVVSVSRNLADRRALEEDLRSVDAEVYLV